MTITCQTLKLGKDAKRWIKATFHTAFTVFGNDSECDTSVIHVPTAENPANIYVSRTDPYATKNFSHRLILDIDLPVGILTHQPDSISRGALIMAGNTPIPYLGETAALVRSTHNWHLYSSAVHDEYAWRLRMLELHAAGIIGPGYTAHSIANRQAALRLPSVKKSPNPPPL